MSTAQATRSQSERLAVQLHQRLDVGLVIALIALLSLGLVMVASASIGVADRALGQPFYYFERQLLFVVLGIVGALAIYHIPLRYWQKSGPMLLLLAYFLLILILLPGIGKTVNGSTRWLPLGLISLQVSELAKLFVAVYIAGYIVRRGREMRETFHGFLKPIVVLSVAAALLLAEPDFGAASVLMAMGMGMLFLGGVRLGQFGLLVMMVTAALAVLAISSPYRLQRLTTFLNPWADPFNSGFQLTQSLIAIGSGSWWGTGLGGSIQKLFYLPEAHNDFLFAVLAEELGFVGILLVVVLYSYVLWRCFAIGAASEQVGRPFGGYLAYGIGLWIGLQAFINMGVNMGLLPTKGLTLPLMSAGGSSMLVMCAAVGLLLRAHRELADGEQPVTPAYTQVPRAKRRRGGTAKRGALNGV